MARKKKNSVPKIPTFNDAPTPERMNQDGGAAVEVVDRNLRGEVTKIRYKAKVTCKLDWYHHRKLITDDMHGAGQRFSSLFFYAGKSKRTTPMYGEFIPSGRIDFDPYVEKTDAQSGLEKALKILSQDETDVIWDVCGSDIHAGSGGRLRHLQTGLRALSVHFGIAGRV